MSVPAKYGVASDVVIDIIKARRRIINLFHKQYRPLLTVNLFLQSLFRSDVRPFLGYHELGPFE